MKNVAGFHSFVRRGLTGTRELFEPRKAFGTIECHKDGWATRGKVSGEVVYIRQFWKREALTGGNKWNGGEWGNVLYKLARRWQYKVVDIVTFMNDCFSDCSMLSFMPRFLKLYLLTRFTLFDAPKRDFPESLIAALFTHFQTFVNTAYTTLHCYAASWSMTMACTLDQL